MRRIRFEQWVLLFVVIVASVSTSVFAVTAIRQADQNRKRIEETRRLTQENKRLAQQNRRLAHQGVIATRVLCAQRVALDKQIARTEAFLDANPNGIPGIPVALIQAGLDDARAQRKPTALLHCPK